jgi:hypothetical protein
MVPNNFIFMSTINKFYFYVNHHQFTRNKTNLVNRHSADSLTELNWRAVRPRERVCILNGNQFDSKKETTKFAYAFLISVFIYFF